MSDPAIPAATLIVVRDRPGGAPELLMVERAEGMAFAGGALVFPGGRIDAADADFAARLGLDDGGAAIAAVRETLEETAIPAGLDPLPDAAAALALQDALLAGRDFAELLDAGGMTLDIAALTPFARWVPKFHAVRRFDTLFLVAAAPPGEWQPNAIAGECAGAFWLSAADVLERDRRGEARLIFPTRRNLERLAQHASVAVIRTDAAAFPIAPITPWVEDHDGDRFVTIPGNLGYPVVREKLEGLWGG